MGAYFILFLFIYFLFSHISFYFIFFVIIITVRIQHSTFLSLMMHRPPAPVAFRLKILIAKACVSSEYSDEAGHRRSVISECPAKYTNPKESLTQIVIP